jgi:hypothetical protein
MSPSRDSLKMTTAHGMDYEIRGQIRPHRNGGYVAAALAVPRSGEGETKELLDSMPTRAQAVARLRVLIVQLGVKVRQEGGQVLNVQTED